MAWPSMAGIRGGPSARPGRPACGGDCPPPPGPERTAGGESTLYRKAGLEGPLPDYPGQVHGPPGRGNPAGLPAGRRKVREETWCRTTMSTE